MSESKPEEWIVVAEDAEGREKIVRSGYRTAEMAGAVRTELERRKFWDDYNLIITTREAVETRGEEAPK